MPILRMPKPGIPLLVAKVILKPLVLVQNIENVLFKLFGSGGGGDVVFGFEPKYYTGYYGSMSSSEGDIIEKSKLLSETIFSVGMEYKLYHLVKANSSEESKLKLAIETGDIDYVSDLISRYVLNAKRVGNNKLG